MYHQSHDSAMSRSLHNVYRGVLAHENMFCKCLVHGRLATRSSALSLSYASAPTNAPLTFPFSDLRSRLRKQQHLLPPSSPSHRIPCPQRRREPLRRRLIASYCTCCEDGSGGCAAPEVCEAKASGQYGCSTPSVTTPGGPNTDIGTCADAG